MLLPYGLSKMPPPPPPPSPAPAPAPAPSSPPPPTTKTTTNELQMFAKRGYFTTSTLASTSEVSRVRDVWNRQQSSSAKSTGKNISEGRFHHELKDNADFVSNPGVMKLLDGARSISEFLLSNNSGKLLDRVDEGFLAQEIKKVMGKSDSTIRSKENALILSTCQVGACSGGYTCFGNVALSSVSFAVLFRQPSPSSH